MAFIVLFYKFINVMFLENNINGLKKKGWIEVICGSMFSGKTEELIRRLKRAEIAQQKVEIFKPKTDNRYSEVLVVSHDANQIRSTPVNNASEILNYINNQEVVGVDEAQFFDDSLIYVCNKLAAGGIRVIVAGLDMDFKGLPFGPIPQLLCMAEYVTKVHAICMDCGNLAHFSFRKKQNNDLVLVGEKDEYEPLCRYCFNKKMKQDVGLKRL